MAQRVETSGTGVVDDRLAVSRQPLDAAAISRMLPADTPWRVRCVDRTGSTNDDLASAANDGAAAGTVLVAHLQTAGRGRRDRSWSAPPGAGLTMSVLVDLAGAPPARLGWVALLAGVAVVDAVSAVTGLRPALKWPNDVLLDDRKLAGLLATSIGDGRVVLGVGVNVSLTSDELPRADATSLLLAGAGSLDRAALAAAVLGELADALARWAAAGWDPRAAGLQGDYRTRCTTLATRVRAELPDGTAVSGTAVDVDEHGALLVDTPTGRRVLTAADVRHVRPSPVPE